MRTRFTDHTGKTFGKWFVESFAGRNKFGMLLWNCICQCGRRSRVSGNNLLCRMSTQCMECGAKAGGEKRTKHGMNHTSEYNSWAHLRKKHLGNVCKRWAKFKNFLADMGRRPSVKHSLVRLDPAKGFTPKNCSWAIVSQGGRGRFQSNNRFARARGERKPISEWSRISGVKRTTIIMRLAAGWDAEDAIFRPVKYIPRRTCECGTVFQPTGAKQPRCAACAIVRRREVERKESRKRRQEKINSSLCAKCSAPAVPGIQLCPKCRERRSQQAAARRARDGGK